jgi:hypothetical protein
MRKPKPVKETKTGAVSANALDRASVKRMLATMQAFMAADPAAFAETALTQRAA